MKRILACLALGLLLAGSAGAQSITAGDLEQKCTAADQGERTICILVVKAYLDGFIEGTGNGVVGVYRYDPAVLDTVKDVKAKDMSPRIGRVMERSTCVQHVSVADMANTFVDYMRGNPGARSGNYRTAMTRAIQAKYCEK
ncbi:hypothetical protein [Cupriavidus sp. CuC1]|uniref:hypothetical protein n=1 Tax=Cupriavidus sp. CuC1 TaxID=3373131 RepID=UPI0037D147A1